MSARLPTMADLAAIARVADPARAQMLLLLRRCLDPANDDIPGDPADLMAVLGECFDALDPAADPRLSIACVGCGRSLSVVLDLTIFVSRDIARQVATLIEHVDCLARAYGWTEPVILSLPPARRRYVAMVRGEPPRDVA